MSNEALVQYLISPVQFFDKVWELNYLSSRKRIRPPPDFREEDVSYPPYDHLREPVEPEDEIGFAVFILAEVLFGFIGFYLSGAERNGNEWNSSRWDWASEATSTAASKGGLDGAITPYAFFYSAEVIGIEATIVVAMAGAYLGISAENKDWDPGRWDVTSPSSYKAALEGMQDCVWLIDDISEIEVFVQKARMGEWEKLTFITISYAIGAILSYYYIARDHNGNYKFWEYDYKSPVTIYGIVKGYDLGTRLPVGFGEIGLEVLEAVERSEGRKDKPRAFFYNFVIRNRWIWAGALWVGVIYVSVENESFDIANWNLASFETLEAFLDGVMFGKDLEEMFVDVRRYFLGSGNGDYYILY